MAYVRGFKDSEEVTLIIDKGQSVEDRKKQLGLLAPSVAMSLLAKHAVEGDQLLYCYPFFGGSGFVLTLWAVAVGKAKFWMHIPTRFREIDGETIAYSVFCYTELGAWTLTSAKEFDSLTSGSDVINSGFAEVSAPTDIRRTRCMES
jgi:hypothetical protein